VSKYGLVRRRRGVEELDEKTDKEHPYDSYLEVILAELKKRQADTPPEDDEEIFGQQPYLVMSGLLAKQEGLHYKQAADYVYDFCARKAPDEIEGHSRVIRLDPLVMAGIRKPWWPFWKR
jgi:hypothetical protein